jgi:hypothetical protein
LHRAAREDYELRLRRGAARVVVGETAEPPSPPPHTAAAQRSQPPRHLLAVFAQLRRHALAMGDTVKCPATPSRAGVKWAAVI